MPMHVVIPPEADADALIADVLEIIYLLNVE